MAAADKWLWGSRKAGMRASPCKSTFVAPVAPSASVPRATTRPSSTSKALVGMGDSMVRMGPLKNNVRFMAAASFFSIMPPSNWVINLDISKECDKM